MDFVDLLKMCVDQKGSDIFITAGADDLLSDDFRQFFVGAGFRFSQ